MEPVFTERSEVKLTSSSTIPSKNVRKVSILSEGDVVVINVDGGGDDDDDDDDDADDDADDDDDDDADDDADDDDDDDDDDAIEDGDDIGFLLDGERIWTSSS
jgi:hypothetical protein